MITYDIWKSECASVTIAGFGFRYNIIEFGMMESNLKLVRHNFHPQTKNSGLQTGNRATFVMLRVIEEFHAIG